MGFMGYTPLSRARLTGRDQLSSQQSDLAAGSSRVGHLDATEKEMAFLLRGRFA